MAKQQFDYFSEDQTTEFNSSFASLERLHRLLIECNHYSRASITETQNCLYYLKLWKVTILAIYREIIPNLSEKEYNAKRIILQKKFDQLKKYNNLVSHNRNEHGDISSTINSNNLQHYWNTLSNIETELRSIATRKGMLITKKGGAMWAMAD